MILVVCTDTLVIPDLVRAGGLEWNWCLNGCVRMDGSSEKDSSSPNIMVV